MTRAQSYDGDMESLPKYARRAHEADRSYYDQARCASPSIDPTFWILEPGKKVKVGGQTVTSEDMMELACLQCELCPVQWECATAAIVGEEPVGVWGDRVENLKVLRKDPNWRRRLERAKAKRVTVRNTIRNMRSGIS